MAFGAKFGKDERLCGKIAIQTLMDKGSRGVCGPLRYVFLMRGDQAPSRLMVSVPKRLFKRAVKRNYLKRRIRESYRLQKGVLGEGVDLLISYRSDQLSAYDRIFSCVGEILTCIAQNGQS